MMVETSKPKKNTKMIWQSISLLGMLLAPGLLLYPGAKYGNSALLVVGYIILMCCMLIPLLLKK